MTKNPLLRTLFVALLAFALVWTVMIVYWRSTNRMPNSTDVALYFVGLPLLLVVGFIGLSAGVKRVRNPPAKESAAADSVETPVEPADPAWLFTLDIIDSSVRLPAGASAAELLAAAEQDQRPELHPQLLDSNGMRLFAAPVQGLEPDDFEDAGDDPESPAVNWDDEHKRALLLAAEVLGEVHERLSVEPEKAEPSLINAGPGAEVPPLPQIHLLLPSRWSEQIHAAAGQWLRQRLLHDGWDPARPPQVNPTPVADVAQALGKLDELNLILNRNDSDARQLVVACDSQLGPRAIEALESARQLMNAERPDGRIPGEGACALLLARTPPAADSPDQTAPLAQLHRLVAGKRELSADARGKVNPDTAVDLMAQAQEKTAVAPVPPPTLVITDADQRGSRTAEAAAAMHAACPDLDPDTQCVALGVANGDSGVVPALAAIALASSHCIDEQQPCLVVSVREPRIRTAMLVGLPPADEPAVDSKAA